MTNIKSQADSNLVATLDWDVPWISMRPIMETIGARGEVQLKGHLDSKDFFWYVYLANENGFIRLTFHGVTITPFSSPTLCYDLKLGGTTDRPYFIRKGPLFSLISGAHQSYSYGIINMFTLPVNLFQTDLVNFMPQDKLIINLKVYTFMGFDDATNVDEIKLYFNPTNEALVNDLKDLLRKPKYSDVTIICCGEALKAHKCILAARSPVFYEMFESVTNEVLIVDVDVSVMKLVLQFIYTGEVDLTENNLVDVLRCAEKCELHELKSVCLEKISSLASD